MSRPPTMAEALDRKLIALNDKGVIGDGIHTFSNGTEWELWADGNCLTCRFYELEGNAGEFCAFEGAAPLDGISPDLARLFGWLYSAENEAKYGIKSAFDSPETCRFHRDRTDDQDGGRSQDAPHDPAQLVLIADPTDDIALPRLPIPEPVEVSR